MDGNQHIAEESIVKLQPLMAKKFSDIIPRVLPWAIFFWADSPFSAISDTFVSSLFLSDLLDFSMVLSNSSAKVIQYHLIHKFCEYYLIDITLLE